MKTYEVTYQVQGVMLVHAANRRQAAELFHDEDHNTNDKIVEGIHAALETYGNDALKILSITFDSQDFTDEWKDKVANGHTFLGYEDWVLAHKEEK